VINYDLNLGYPDLAVVPKELLADLTRELVCSNRGLQYGGDLRGVQPVREAVSGFLSEHTGDAIQPSELMITVGSLQAIDIACRTLTKPGDVVLVESPTFFFALNLLRMSHVELVGVPMCPDGIDLERLQDVIERRSPRLMYTIPSYQNPTGICATAENRKQLVALAQKHNFVLLEDTAYQFLSFAEPAPPMLKHYDEGSGHVVTVGTFSKLVAPSLRQGWMWATQQQIDLFTGYKSDASASTLTCELITEYLRRGGIDQQIVFLQDFYRRKCACMAKAMAEHFPDWASWTIPDGGFFVWVTLPEHISVKNLRTAAHARGVDFMPGLGCFTEPVTDRYLRLCFAYIGEDEIEAGVATPGSCLRDLPH
jgi:2-aminoadipate transaminase